MASASSGHDNKKHRTICSAQHRKHMFLWRMIAVIHRNSSTGNHRECNCCNMWYSSINEMQFILFMLIKITYFTDLLSQQSTFRFYHDTVEHLQILVLFMFYLFVNKNQQKAIKVIGRVSIIGFDRSQTQCVHLSEDDRSNYYKKDIVQFQCRLPYRTTTIHVHNLHAQTSSYFQTISIHQTRFDGPTWTS